MNYKKFVKESSAIRYSIRNKNVVCYSRDTDSVYMNGKKLTNSEDGEGSSTGNTIGIIWDPVNGISEMLLQKLNELTQDMEAFASTNFRIITELIYTPVCASVDHGEGEIIFKCIGEFAGEGSVSSWDFVVNLNTGALTNRNPILLNTGEEDSGLGGGPK